METHTDALLYHQCDGRLEKLWKLKIEIRRYISNIHPNETVDLCHSRHQTLPYIRGVGLMLVGQQVMQRKQGLMSV